MKLRIVQQRWIRWSDEENNNRRTVTWRGESMKKARGQVKALAHSAKDMMEKHDWSDGQMFDARQGILRYYDDEGVWFEETYTIESEE